MGEFRYDNFNDYTLDAFWTWDSDTSGAYIETNGPCHIDLTAGTGTMYGGTQDPCWFYQAGISGDFDIYTKLSLYDALVSDKQHTGIMAMVDANSHIFIARYHWAGNSWGGGEDRVVVQSSYHSSTNYDNGAACTADPVWLRMKRVGSTFYTYYATSDPDAGGAWIEVTHASKLSSSADVMLGLFANTDGAAAFTAYYYWVRPWPTMIAQPQALSSKFQRGRQLANAKVNWKHPINKGLVNWWPLTDKSGRDLVGTVQGAVNGCTVVASDPGRALYFNNTTDDWVNGGPTPQFNALTQFSVSFWAYQTDVSANHMIVHRGSFNSYNGCFEMVHDINIPGYDLKVQDVNTHSALFARSAPIVANTWHHVVGVAEASRVLVYLNGAPQPYVTYNGCHELLTGGTNYDDRTTIGKYSYSSDTGEWPQSGYMRDMQFFNRALTAKEVLYLYEHPYGTPENPRLLPRMFVPLKSPFSQRTAGPLPLFFRP